MIRPVSVWNSPIWKYLSFRFGGLRTAVKLQLRAWPRLLSVNKRFSSVINTLQAEKKRICWYICSHITKASGISIKKSMKDSSKSCSKKCLTPHVKGHKETYGHRCAPWTPEKWILRWLQGYDIASKQRFVKILTYKESQIIWIHSIFQRKKSTSIFGREEMFPDTIERLVRPTCVRGHRVQGKSHRSFPTHQKTVEKGLWINQYFL